MQHFHVMEIEALLGDVFRVNTWPNFFDYGSLPFVLRRTEMTWISLFEEPMPYGDETHTVAMKMRRMGTVILESCIIRYESCKDWFEGLPGLNRGKAFTCHNPDTAGPHIRSEKELVAVQSQIVADRTYYDITGPNIVMIMKSRNRQSSHWLWRCNNSNSPPGTELSLLSRMLTVWKSSLNTTWYSLGRSGSGMLSEWEPENKLYIRGCGFSGRLSRQSRTM